VRDVQDVVEAAIGGMPVSTVVAGRARYSVNVRYAADFRADPDALRTILVPIRAAQPVAVGEGSGSGRGSAPVEQAQIPAGGAAGMGTMGGGESGMGGAASMSDADAGGGASGPSSADNWDRWQQSGSAVPLGALAGVQVVKGPPMIKDENGVLVGYVFADIDGAQRDLGGWVRDAKRLVQARLATPPGYRLQWTGQYEFMAEMQARMRLVLPLTLVLIVALLYLSLRGWPQTWLVLLSLPFAIAGSVWLLALLHYNLSTAVWVGLIAVGGVAAQTGIVVVVYLDQAFGEALMQGRLRTGDDVDSTVVEGAAKCLRPMPATVATTVLGLMPLLFESGVGADLSARTAAPVVGGLWSCMFLTLLVLPAAYAIWRRWQLARGRLPAPPAAVAR
jgi:Cu(I)/Ag(I) efflux system membrane protein CusA/SilA